jgi:putative zinc finger/helix-turn-helix YgiT family protein
MEQVYYCNECNKLIETRVVEKKQTLNVKGKDITLCVPVRVCDICGGEILDEELDSKSLEQYYNKYRLSEHLLMPDEIKNIRIKYNLSQVSFARFLGFGEKTIARYENGAIQDVCHDNIIRLVNSMDAFVILWKERKNCLSHKEQVYINSLLRNYNKTKIQLTYSRAPIYNSDLLNVYSFNKGELDYAG